LRSSVREIPAAGEKMYNNESPFTWTTGIPDRTRSWRPGITSPMDV
jgi:hypothetical protein